MKGRRIPRLYCVEEALSLAGGIRGRFSDPFLFAVKDAVDDSIWDSGESGKLAEARSLIEAGEYNHAA